MKRVLVPLAEKAFVENDKAPLHFARATYIEKLVDLGLMPVFVSSKMSDEMILEAYTMCQGVLFMGGSDFDPATYGRPLHEKTEALEPGRDRIELTILTMLIEDEKPYLGICRGNQALVIASGGELEPHVPDLGLSEQHGLSETQGYNDLWGGPTHPVLIEAGTRISSVLGVDSVVTNTAHHQAGKSVGEGFRVAGRSPAGVMEMVERVSDTHFCVGVQCHPEAGQFLDKLFAAFAEAVENYHN